MDQQKTTPDLARGPQHRQVRRVVHRLVPVGLAVLVGIAAGLFISSGHTAVTAPQVARVSAPVAPVPTTVAASSATATSPEADPGRGSRTLGGAVSAAAGYATILSKLFPMDAAQARSAVAGAASDAARADMVAAVDAKLVPLQQQAAGLGGVTTYRQSVLATRVDSYDAQASARAGEVHQAAVAAPARASVYVWTLLTITQSDSNTENPSAAIDANAVGSFATVRLDMVWERGAWRINDNTTLDGPTPLIDGSPSTGTELNSQLRGFEDWRPL